MLSPDPASFNETRARKAARQSAVIGSLDLSHMEDEVSLNSDPVANYRRALQALAHDRSSLNQSCPPIFDFNKELKKAERLLRREGKQAVIAKVRAIREEKEILVGFYHFMAPSGVACKDILARFDALKAAGGLAQVRDYMNVSLDEKNPEAGKRQAAASLDFK